jgi:hypothetical protein
MTDVEYIHQSSTINTLCTRICQHVASLAPRGLEFLVVIRLAKTCHIDHDGAIRLMGMSDHTIT